MTTKKETSHFINLAWLAFAGFGLELVILLLEALLYKTANFSEWALSQNLLHWGLTCLAWGAAVWLLCGRARRAVGFDVFAHKEKATAKEWLFVAALAAACLVVSILSWQLRFKPYAELTSMLRAFGGGGAAAFAFQYFYYLFESMLITLTIVFAQEYGERKFGKAALPWGGLFLGVTWGLTHTLTQGSLTTGITLLLLSCAYGLAYLLLRKNVRYFFPVLFLMFVL